MVNFDALGVDECESLIKGASERLARIRSEDKARVKREIAEFAKEKGFTIEEVLGNVTPIKAGKSKAGKSVAPKYRSPDGKTWTGRGSEPLWIRGKDRSQFLIAV